MTEGTQPLLSVCIPTWNRAVFLEQAVQSVFRDLDDAHCDDVEVVVSDNASTDETARVVERLQANHANLRYERQPENLGFDANYRASLMLARGRFAMTLGDDDWFEEGGVRRICQVLQCHPELVGLTVLANGYSAAGERIAAARSGAGVREVQGARRIFAFGELGFLFGNMSLHVVDTKLAQHLLTTNPLLGNGCACHQLCCLAVRERDRWALLEEACVAWRYGNDSFSKDGLHRRLRLALRGYRENLEVVFGKESPLVADFLARDAIHIARRYVLRSKNAPALNQHYGSYRSSVHEQLNIALESLTQLGTQPAFWRRVAPSMLVPSPLFRLAVRMRAARRRA